ncbi:MULTISPECIES: carboxymuconolactone decarboxylase family protein [Modicisalibacter]|uniref:carboxymuconolactone decarboxylase family protein n=1 Tax=Modicisalibacter TaxID=574347 RepID=UPI00100BC471|nr:MULTISPECIES: carboxymuconolactone decarboxylase family protein [Halomonadaceae]MBZ9558790.1 carboxymuconolactone decarboxylase family protein [Modicisalibacter sp. R2A 31.J]MBZ9575319.1 carboxymuconolactone decarboxylase family protein [Modicisalibacter sp. MOD 31.J]
MSRQQLPAGAARLAEQYPEVWDAYAGLGEACAEAGPLDARTRRLIKLALAVGTRSEGAVHSHVRRARAEGIDDESLKQVALLAIPTLGFPNAIAALTWVEDLLDE